MKVRNRRCLAFWMAGFFGISSSVFSGEPSLKDFKLPLSVPLKTSEYAVESVERSAEHPGFLKFHVYSAHAEYDAEGLLPLIKLLHEIEVIEQLARNENSSGFVDGAVHSVKATGAGFAALVKHPVDSAKGVGKAAGKLGRKLGGAFRKSQEGEKSTVGEKILGSVEREAAKEFGVDVHTENPYLREVVARIARARLGGRGAVMVVKFLIPVALLVSVTLTASGVNSAADQLVNDADRADLFRENKKGLLELGFGKEETWRFLNHWHYSPREATYLRFYLQALKEAGGFREILKKASQSGSKPEALKILHEVQIAAQAVQKAKFEKVRLFEEGLLATESQRLILMTSYDYLESSRLGERILELASRMQKEENKKDLEIWNGGKITDEFSSQASRMGFRTRPEVLFEK